MLGKSTWVGALALVACSEAIITHFHWDEGLSEPW